jgi:hypothetical protein
MANAAANAFEPASNQASDSKSGSNSQTKLEPLHRFHSSYERFPSEVAETAIQKFSNAGESLLDPPCGSTTSLTAGPAQAGI